MRLRTLAIFVFAVIGIAPKGFAMECDAPAPEADIVVEGTLTGIFNELEVAHGGEEFQKEIQKNGVPYWLTVAVTRHVKGESADALSFFYAVKNAPAIDVKEAGRITGITTPEIDLKLGDKVTLALVRNASSGYETLHHPCGLIKRE